MKTKLLLMAAAVAEFGTGLVLLVAPSFLTGLLLGEALGPAVATVVGRVAGAALIAIGLACWLESGGKRAGLPTGLLAGLLLYNTIVAFLLVHAAVFDGIHGVLLWPVVVVHIVFAIWCAVQFRFERGTSSR